MDYSARLSQLGGQTMRAYEPSWRDKIASLMMGDGRASPERRNFVQGMLGSTGLGTQGVGVVDATPLGSLMDLHQSAKEGDKTGMSLAALGLIPGAKVAEKLSDLGKTAPHIIAYHGSPHSFDRFDLSKIGTGEGAQAYGHGLYFADNEDVARGYREALSPYGRGASPEDVAARVIQGAGGDREAALAELRRRIDAANAQGVPYQQVQELMQARNIANTNPEVAGSMYQVRINADPAHFLDWDKPLSEQGPHIQSALSDMKPDWTGGQIHESSRLVPGDFFDKRAASSALQERGLAGIKYLDQGSRGAGEGSRNYVVFNDKLIDILKKYGILLPGAGLGMAAQGQQGQPVQQGAL